MRCPHCDHELPENARFCSACGRSLEKVILEKPAGMEDIRHLEERIRFLEEQKDLLSKAIKTNAAEHKQLETLQKEENDFRIEVSQLKLVQEQKSLDMPYRKEEGERYFLALQREEKEEAKKEERPERQIDGWIGAGIALCAVVIFAYFMGWVEMLRDFSLWTIAKETENPAVLLAYLAPVLYGVYMIRLGTEKNFEEAAGMAWAAFGVNMLVVVVTLLWCVSVNHDDYWRDFPDKAKLATGAWLAVAAGIGGMALAGFAPKTQTEISAPESEKRTQNNLFQVPVLNYPALLPVRPLKITVDGKRRLSVTFVQYQAKLQLAQADIDLVDRFHNVYCIRNMKISGLNWKGDGYQSECEESVYNGPEDIVYAKVYIRQHSLEEGRMAEKTVPLYAETDLPVEHLKELRRQPGRADAFFEAEKTAGGWRCTCGTENREDEDSCICCRKRRAGVLH